MNAAMNAQTPRLAAVAFLLVSGMAVPPAADAAGRRFEPVPQSAAQPVKTVGEASIISMAGKQFQVGASIAPESSRHAWLSVSIKNMSATPLEMRAKAVVVTGNGQPLAVRDADEATKPQQKDGYVRDPCALATTSSVLNCNTDDFNRRQAERAAAEAAGAKPEAEQLGSGQLLVRQYELDLPKKSKTGPALIKVSVTLGGEQISFDFKEVD
jgi:hypothetical protein